MPLETRVNGSGIPKVYLTPANAHESLAFSALLEMAEKGQAVSLTRGDVEGSVVLTVRGGRPASEKSEE